MNNIQQIINVYEPIQPDVNASDNHVKYHEFMPHLNLRSHIYCYWQLKTRTQLHEIFRYRVVADGCIDIIFELGSPQNSCVMGFSNTYNEFVLQDSFNYVGIRFLPSSFPQLFNINALELSNKIENLDIVIPPLANFIKNHFYISQNSNDIVKHLNTFFLKFLINTKFKSDSRVSEAINIILRKRGMVEIKKDLNTGLSDRQLRRLFEFYIGASVKSFSNVIRFQNVLDLNFSEDKILKEPLFFDAGYYDQAHFIKEFKKLYGVTPNLAFNKNLQNNMARKMHP